MYKNNLNKNNLNKKSQVEVLGLAVVIIIIVIGMTFYINVVSRQSTSPKSQKNTEDDVLLATNILTSMLKTNTGNRCNGNPDIKTLIEDCINNPDTQGTILCGGILSCAFLDSNIVDQFIDPVLTPLGKDYNFKVIGTSFIQSKKNTNSICDNVRKEITPTPPIRVYGYIDTVTLQIELCYGV